MGVFKNKDWLGRRLTTLGRSPDKSAVTEVGDVWTPDTDADRLGDGVPAGDAADADADWLGDGIGSAKDADADVDRLTAKVGATGDVNTDVDRFGDGAGVCEADDANVDRLAATGAGVIDVKRLGVPAG